MAWTDIIDKLPALGVGAAAAKAIDWLLHLRKNKVSTEVDSFKLYQNALMENEELVKQVRDMLTQQGELELRLTRTVIEYEAKFAELKTGFEAQTKKLNVDLEAQREKYAILEEKYTKLEAKYKEALEKLKQRQ